MRWLGCFSLVAALCFAAGARAQSPDPVPSPPAAPQAAPWPAPGETSRLQDRLSQRLILNRGPSWGGGYRLEQGGVVINESTTVAGLDRALAGSDTAVELARRAHRKLVTASALTWVGLGLAVGAVVGVTASASLDNPNDRENGALISAGVAVVALVMDIIAVPMAYQGVRLAFDAVNAYNADLVDGRLMGPLRPPTPAPVPVPR